MAGRPLEPTPRVLPSAKVAHPLIDQPIPTMTGRRAGARRQRQVRAFVPPSRRQRDPGDHPELDREPDGLVEKVGNAVGVDSHQAKADTKRFKEFIENRGDATGAWRGDVARPDA